MGYDVVGEIDQIGDDVRDFQIGDRVADMTRVNADFAVAAGDVARVPGHDAADAATLILSRTRVQLRAARVQEVSGSSCTAPPALRRCSCSGLAGLELWGTARGEQGLSSESLAQLRSTTNVKISRVLPGGFDVIIDGVGEDGYRRSYAALKRGGLLCAIGFSRACSFSVNVMRADIPSGLRRTWSGCSAYWQLAPSGRVRRAICFRQGRRGPPPPRGRRSRGQARAVPVYPRPASTQVTAATGP